VAEHRERLGGGQAGGIGHARPRQDVHHRRQAVDGGGQARGPDLGGRERLRDRVGQEDRGDPLDVGPGEVALHEPAGRRAGGRAVGEADLPRGRDEFARRVIAARVGERNVNFPEHRGHPWRGRGG